MKEALAVLDHVHLNYNKDASQILNIVIAFIMFGVALDIKPEHFRNVLMKPKSVVLGVFSQFLVLPLATFIFVVILNPTPAVALGMILIAACPGGNISNFMSAVAKANVALSVSLTAVATIAATFMTPLNFIIWGKLYMDYFNKTESGELLPQLAIDFGQTAQTVLILLGIPVALGLLCSIYLPDLTNKIKKPIRKISIYIFISFVIILLAANFKNFMQYINLIFIIVLIHNFIALGSGFTVATLFKLPDIDRRTLTIETGIQNSALALALIFNDKIFDPNLALGGMAFIAAWWGVWHIISGLSIATLWSKKRILQAI